MLTPLIPAPNNHYWLVGDHSPAGEVYSSASQSYVSNTDATYLAWLAAGGQASAIATHAELMDLMQAEHPAGAGIDPRVWRMMVKLAADLKSLKQGGVPAMTLNFTQDVDALLARFPQT